MSKLTLQRINSTRGLFAGATSFLLVAACSSSNEDPGTGVSNVAPSSTLTGQTPVDTTGMGTTTPTTTSTVMSTAPTAAPTMMPGTSNTVTSPTNTGTSMPTTAPTDTAMMPTGTATAPMDTAMMPTGTATAMPTDTGTTMPTDTMPPASTTTPPTMPEHQADHCKFGYDPDPTDATMAADGYVEYTANGQTDTTVQPEVIAWMEKTKWQSAHYQWHAVRRCGSGMGGGGFFGAMPGSEENNAIQICELAEVPADQECKTAGDGYQFMAMHRHMITSLKALWPTHTEQFEGWDEFPTSADDVPEPWRDSWGAWDSMVAPNLDKAQNIEDHVGDFADEGAFGQWMQCTASGIHGALHFKWVRQQNQDHGLGNQYRNIDNYMFWKMHGWMDKVWERYRVAKGLAPDEPKLVQEIEKQCREMDALALIVDPSLEQEPSNEPLPEESGEFHEKVRPIFEGALNCAGCHGPQAPSGGLSLGGQISSADIVANLVSQPAEGTNKTLVIPGDPENSWLYLKISGGAATATCTGTDLCTEPMPPSGGMMVSDADKKIIYDWIEAGAPGPT